MQTSLHSLACLWFLKALAFSEIYNRELCMGKRLFHFRKSTESGRTIWEQSLCTEKDASKRNENCRSGKHAWHVFGGRDTNPQADVCVCEEGTCKNGAERLSLSASENIPVETTISTNDKGKIHKSARLRHTVHGNKPSEADDWIAETGDTDWLDMDVIDTTFVEGHIDMLK